MDKTYAFVTVSQLAAIHGITLEPGVVYNGLTDEVAQQIADGSYSPTEFTTNYMKNPNRLTRFFCWYKIN